MVTPEARSEQSPSGEPLIFHLTHVGNQEVIDSLALFRKEGMNGPRAAGCLFSLFEPLPVGEDNLGLIRSGETKPKTLAEQLGWAYAKPQELTEEQKGALPALLYFPLESLANNPQVRRVGGEERDLSQKARQEAKDVFEEYNQYLAKTLNPDNPDIVNIRKTIAAIGSAASLVAGTITLAAYAATIKAAPTIRAETGTPTPSTTYSTEFAVNLKPTAEPTPMILTEKTVMDQAGWNFSSALSFMDKSANPAIASLRLRAFSLQESGLGTVFTSKPEFDIEGNLIQRTSAPMICGFESNGNFRIIINSTLYFNKDPLPIELTAVHLAECLNLHDEIQNKFIEFSKDNPNIGLTTALAENPDWHSEAVAKAWYYATKDILIPNRDIVPKGNNIYNLLISIYDSVEGNEEQWVKLFNSPAFQGQTLQS